METRLKMYCPKCGNEVPDGSSFCGKCGNQFENASKRSTPASKPETTDPAALKSGFALRANSAGVAAVLLMVIAIILTFVPWFDVSDYLTSVGAATSGFANGLSSLAGSSSNVGNSFDFEDSYAVWSLVGLADSFDNYAGIHSSLGGSGATGFSAIVDAFSCGCLILWLVSLALSIWGIVAALMRGSVGALRAGCIFIVIMVIVFYVFAGVLGREAGTANAIPALCLILSVLSICCSFAARKRA